MTHQEHPNVALFRKMDEAMKAGGPTAMGDFIADDVEWHEIGRAEPIRGKAALEKRYEDFRDFADALTVDVHDTLANDDHVVQLVTATVQTDGAPFVYRTCEIYHVRDGKITARWAFSDDTDRINKFFGGR